VEQPRLAKPLAVILLVGLFLFGFPHAKPESFLDLKETEYSPEVIAERGISVTTAEEYEPIWVQERSYVPVREILTLLDGEATWQSNKLSPIHYTLQVNVTNEARLRMNIFYFPGWTLSIDDKKQSIDYQNLQGLIEFGLEPGEHRVELFFANTPVRNLSVSLSLLALIFLLLTLGLSRKPEV